MALKLPWALPPELIFFLTFLLTMALTAGVGVTIERVAYRPLRRKGASRLYVVITALMVGLILENGNLALLGASRKNFPELIPKVIYTLGGSHLHQPQDHRDHRHPAGFYLSSDRGPEDQMGHGHAGHFL